jgi:hypothetical protein
MFNLPPPVGHNGHSLVNEVIYHLTFFINVTKASPVALSGARWKPAIQGQRAARWKRHVRRGPDREDVRNSEFGMTVTPRFNARRTGPVQQPEQVRSEAVNFNCAVFDRYQRRNNSSALFRALEKLHGDVDEKKQQSRRRQQRRPSRKTGAPSPSCGEVVWVENEEGIPRIPSLKVAWHVARGIARHYSVVAEVGVGYIILYCY